MDEKLNLDKEEREMILNRLNEIERILKDMYK